MLELVSNCLAVFWATGVNVEIKDNLSYIGAGMAAIGCAGVGIGQGYTGGKAVEGIARNPEAGDQVRTLFIIGNAITESGAIYALIIAIILAFVVA